MWLDKLNEYCIISHTDSLQAKPHASMAMTLLTSRLFVLDEINKLTAQLKSELERFEKTRNSMSERAANSEKELQVTLQNEKITHEEDVERLTKEKVGALHNVLTLHCGAEVDGSLCPAGSVTDWLGSNAVWQRYSIPVTLLPTSA